MDRPTFDDANLILRLYEMRREDKMREARVWFFDNYYCKTLAEGMQLCPAGSAGNAYFRQVTSYWEMVASFVTNGILNEELLFQSGQELLLTWTRIKPITQELRKAFGNPNAWKNLETVGEKFIEHMNRNAPGSYEAFAARIGTKPEAAQAQKAQ
jgi:hypothetical protein